MSDGNARAAFGRAVDAYDARPPYPQRLFELLEERCGLRRGAVVLEVGAGTGQATAELVRRGMAITAVELSEPMAARLRDRLAAHPVDIVVGAFEDLSSDAFAASFDAVVSATAFHWVRPDVGHRKVAQMLRPHGWLALWWTIFDDPARPDGVLDALRPVYAEVAPSVLASLSGPPTYCYDERARTDEIAAAEAFGDVDVIRFDWEQSHSPTELRDLIATYSPLLALEERERDRLLGAVESTIRSRFGERVTRTYATIVYLAQRNP